MKKILIATALFAGCVTHTQAGIPVFVDFDATATKNQITNYAQMLKEYSTMLDQLEQMRSQFEQMEKEYESVTGVRNLGDILNDPEFKDYLPDDWQSVYQGVRNNGYSGLSDSAKAIRDSTKIFDACAELVNDTEKQICNAQAVKPAQDQAFSMDAYQKSQERVSQIEGLMQEINNTRDPKAVAEINARIQAEQAMIGNEQAKLALYQASAESEQRILIQQEEEAHKKRFTSDDYGSQVSPMEFN